MKRQQVHLPYDAGIAYEVGKRKDNSLFTEDGKAKIGDCEIDSNTFDILFDEFC